MGDITGFLKTKRKNTEYRPVCERILDYQEVFLRRKTEESQQQASRCMDCGTAFCHWACPLANVIPEYNDLVFRGKWEKAAQILLATNNLPEVTGRVCPALCEYACVLGVNDEPVTIRENELAIIEYAFEQKLIKPRIPVVRTGKQVAIVGSGPAGLACADQLNQAGHTVVVFERDDKIGGLLRYGIPDFKLDKKIIDRRINIWQKEGIQFKPGINVGSDILAQDLVKQFDAVCFSCGAGQARDLNIEGRQCEGIYFAMDYLVSANRYAAKQKNADKNFINAQGKRVVIIGGGDTGSDCVGTANRQQAACVIQLEVMPKPQECRTNQYPWPKYPLLLKVTSSHEEGCQRQWAVLTKKFITQQGKVKKISCVKVEFTNNKNCRSMQEIPGSQFELDADLVIIAIGFTGPQTHGAISQLGLEKDNRGNIKTDNNFMTSRNGVFAAGDARRGQSLIVWAITEGRQAAQNIDRYLMKVV
jgi:glutamate synthase (NADPH/NADH) small chain